MRFVRLILLIAMTSIAFALAILARQYPWPVLLGLIICAFVEARRKYTRLTTLGSARWADGHDLRRAGMLDADSGLILGRINYKPGFWAALWGLFNPRLESGAACERFLESLRKPKDHLVRLSNAVHTAIFAPTGVGKGVSFVVPFLKTCPDSCVVVDLKAGELARLTAQHRREAFGHDVKIIDPFGVVTKTPDCLNVLDGISKDDPLAIDDCRDLAAAMVVRTGEEREPQWNDSAEAWIAAMVACVVQYGEGGQRSLQTMRQLLSNPQKMQKAIELMCKSDAWQGMLSRMGFGLTRYVDRELGSTLTTTNRHLRFLDTIAIAESTSRSTFDPAIVRNGKTTVYLVLPPEYFRSNVGLVRLWIGCFLRAVMKGGLQEKNEIHFVCDEASELGKMDQIADALTIGRGFGLRMQLYYQDCGQVLKCWPNGADQTLYANTSQVYFGVNDQKTAEYVSARLDAETVIVDSGGTSEQVSHSESGNGQTNASYSWTRSANWQQQARKLLTPGEVMALPSRMAITFAAGVAPICTKLLRYYEEPKLGMAPGRWQRLMKGIRAGIECAALVLAAVLVLAVVTHLR